MEVQTGGVGVWETRVRHIRRGAHPAWFQRAALIPMSHSVRYEITVLQDNIQKNPVQFSWTNMYFKKYMYQSKCPDLLGWPHFRGDFVVLLLASEWPEYEGGHISGVLIRGSISNPTCREPPPD